jgi:hypothetical protein
MFAYTKHNYFTWGWGETPFSKYGIGQRFFAQLDFSKLGVVGSWRDECIQAARDIASSTNKPLLLGFSGGLDSQAAWLSFKEAGIPVKAMFCHYVVGKNQHDYVVAKQFAKKHGIELLEVHTDVEKFYQEKSVALCGEIGVGSPRQLLQATLGDFFPDHCYIMAAGDMKPALDPDTNQLFFNIGATPVVQYQINRQQEAVTRFYMYSPELLVAQLNHPLLKLTEMAVNAIAAASPQGYNTSLYTHVTKPLIYTDAWGDALVQAPKYTGFEVVEKSAIVRGMGGRNVLGDLGRGLVASKARFTLPELRAAAASKQTLRRVASVPLQPLQKSS